MFRSIQRASGLLLLLGFFASCEKSSEGPQAIVKPLDDNSLPAGAIQRVAIINKSDDKITFSVDLIVFRDSKNVENQLNSTHFLSDTQDVKGTEYYVMKQSAGLTGKITTQTFDALMLFDQSGSITSTDRDDLRIDAGKAFCKNLGTGNKASIWSFQGSGATKYGSGFGTDTAFFAQTLDDLKGKTTGGTPLYKSQHEVIQFIADSSRSTNKNILTFTDGDDTQGGFTSEEICAFAMSKGVKLYNIGLREADAPALSQQALCAGGSFMFAKDARQLISMFGNLGKVLGGLGQYYHTQWEIKPKTGTFSKSDEIQLNMKIALPYGGTLRVPYVLQY